MKKFETWKIINLGTGLVSVEDFLGALMTENMLVGDGAEAHFDCYIDPNEKIDNEEDLALSKRKIVSERTLVQIELVLATPFDFGFSNDHIKVVDFFARAKKFGLSLCPAEVGPQLRLQFKDQLPDTDFGIAMEFLPAEWPRYEIYFNLESRSGEYEGLWLDATCAQECDQVYLHNNFVFTRIKQ